MTVNSTVSSASYAGTGTTATYPYGWGISSNADLVVYTYVTSTASLVLLTQPSGYTVSGAGNPTGGTITLTAGNLPVGTSIYIASSPAQVQSLLLQQGAAFNSNDLMNAFDYLCREVQAVDRKYSGSLRISEPLKAIGATNTVIPLPAARQLLGWDSTGTQLVNVQPAFVASSGSSSVKSFGAMGDGVTDDTDAIQAAINAAYTINGGGVVLFPTGTYIVRIAQTSSSTFKHALTIYPGIVLRGESRERSVIKLKSGAGNYNAIISRALVTDSDMNDFGMYDLCIDCNNTGNIPATMGDIINVGNYRFTVLCYGGRRINIKNCWFRDFKCLNVLELQGPIGTVGDLQIVGNKFDHGASSSVANDHSTIYTSADNVLIDGNIFTTPSIGTFGATAAIELHGSNQIACNNIIKRYRSGCNLTGAAYESNGLCFVNNVIEDTCYGVILWSYFLYGNTTKPALTNCLISGNSIRINRDGWAAVIANIACGITWDQTGTAPCEGLIIRDNIIHYEPTTITNVSDIYSCGIDWERPSVGGVGYDQDITITGNIITGAPANGIRTYGPIRRLTLENNTIRNCGQSVSGTFVAGNRAAIFAFSPASMVQWIVKGNRFVDDQATPTMTMGMIVAGSQSTNCQFIDNIWTVGAGHTYPVYYGSFVPGEGWFVRHVFDVYPVTIVGEVKAGSSLLVSSTGVLNTQVAAPQGTIYVPTVARLYGAFQVLFGQASGLGAPDASLEITAQFAGQASLLLGSTLPAMHWLRGPSGSFRGLQWITGSASQRWIFAANGAESGSNAGADLNLLSYDDAGAFADVSFVWTRAVGKPFFWYRPMAIESGLSPAQLIVTAATYPLLANNIWVTFTGTAQCVMTAPSASVYGSGRPWVQWIKNRTTSGVSILYRRSGADTIDGSTDDVVINPGETAMFVGNGASDILVVDRSGGDTSRIATRTLRAVNLNNAGVDAATAVRLPGNYRVRKVTVTNASISLTTATFSLRTAAAGAGTAIVSAAGLAALTTSAKVTEPAIAVTDRQSATTLYLRNDTAQGAAATADFIIEFEDLR